MGRRKPWHSFEGLDPRQRRAKARRGVICALVTFVLMNLVAFLL